MTQPLAKEWLTPAGGKPRPGIKMMSALRMHPLLKRHSGSCRIISAHKGGLAATCTKKLPDFPFPLFPFSPSPPPAPPYTPKHQRIRPERVASQCPARPPFRDGREHTQTTVSQCLKQLAARRNMSPGKPFPSPWSPLRNGRVLGRLRVKLATPPRRVDVSRFAANRTLTV